MIGQVIGHYRVDERIGAGGMGVVYRAFDTRLRRPVAIKLLSDPSITSDVARGLILAEARMASGLSHPHICTVFDVGEVEGRVFLVMEYIEGRSIDALIPEGGFPTETVNRHGANIAAALEHAHGRGVLHRDLKAANVVITAGGAAKVLDFGIARRTSPAGVGDSTRSATHAGAGAIAGTLAYIAPEVLTGGPASVQSDIWSLGILLYEMASGTLPFTGRSTFELTAAILREPPAPMPTHVPPALRAIIQRCLTKEPTVRYGRAGEVRAALEAIGADRGGTANAAPAGGPARPRRRLAAISVAIVGLGLLVALWWRAPWAGTPSHQTADPGEGRLLLLASSEQRILDPALSPDGRMIAYVGEDQSRRLDLFVAQIPGGGRIRLTDDAAAEGWPRFSPDGQRVAFTRQEGGITSVYVTSAFGGAMVKVVTTASEPSWSRDGTRLAFVYRPNRGRPPAVATSLADGSDVRILFTAEHADPFIRNTSWSADGQLIAFVLSSGGTAGAVWTIPAGGGTPRRLTSDPVGVFSAEPVFTPDGRHLILSSNRGGATNLWSVPVGGGAPVRLTTGPGPDVSPSVAADGAVAFLNSRWRNALMVVDLERGQSRTVLTHSPYLWAPTMSPDGALIAFSRGETGGLWHIWTVPSQGGDARQLTFGDKGEIYPRFTPDGSTVVYHTWGDPHRIWKVALAGGPPAAVTPEGAPDEAWADVSPDGRWLAFVRVEAGVERTHIAPIGGGASRLLTTTPATTPRWSPDGARLAFSHNRSYGGGVSVIDADGRDERRLSDTGGWPVWWPDGRSLAMLTVGGRGDQEVQMIDLAGRPLAARAWPRFAGTNQLFDVLRGGSAIVTALAVHQSDEIWLLRR